MSRLKYQPVPHDHQDFIDRAMRREGFKEAYEKLGAKYAEAREECSKNASR